MLEPPFQDMRSAFVNGNIPNGGLSLACRNGEPPAVLLLLNVLWLQRTQFVQSRPRHQCQFAEVMKYICVSLRVTAAEELHQSVVAPLSTFRRFTALGLLADAVPRPRVIPCEPARL